MPEGWCNDQCHAQPSFMDVLVCACLEHKAVKQALKRKVSINCINVTGKVTG